MNARDVEAILNEALEGRLLLTHAFYRRWEDGALAWDELGDYAGQYRHAEATQPAVLATVLAAISADETRALVAATLAEECSPPNSHLELFETFAEAVEAPTSAEPARATRDLVSTYRSAASAGPFEGLACIAAYELQAAAVAATKGAGLRRHYGLDERATAFWDLHAAIEEQHAAWSVEALASLDGRSEVLYSTARAAADAWWYFLDEREGAAGGRAGAKVSSPRA